MLAIQLDHVTKRYRVGRSRTLVDLVASKIDRLRGKREQMHIEERGTVDAMIWALRDVCLDVPQGAGLGVIGRNGAGKTTLLKLVSRVTWPTRGTVRVGGHVVSLIELGAGFHPELTGRENVYLGAGLFGLTRRETEQRFDEIVHFADVARLIDTPMKRYSSGLYARLGFAVAIFSNPDIVLVDEVLAVGDAPFRRRAVEALGRLIAQGKTVLFISHDLWSVRRLCSDILWMEEGRVRAYGPASVIAERYMDEINLDVLAGQDGVSQGYRGGTGEVRYGSVELTNAAGQPTRLVASDDTLVVRATYRAGRSVEHPVFQIAIVDVDTGVVVATATSAMAEVPSHVIGSGVIECRFDHLPLCPRQYLLRLSITDSRQLLPYDVLTAGPRFAVTAQRGTVGNGLSGGNDGNGGNGGLKDTMQEDGLISLPFEFTHRASALEGRESVMTPDA